MMKEKLASATVTSSIWINLADQNPGAKTKKTSCQDETKKAMTGKAKIKALIFIITNPSTLLSANELTIKAIPGACKAPRMDIIKIIQKLDPGKKLVA